MVLELAPQNEELSREFEKVFGRWRQALAAQFEILGITPGRAPDVADLVMSVFEGCLVVSRALRRIDSFRTAIEALAELVEREPRLSAGDSQAARADLPVDALLANEQAAIPRCRVRSPGPRTQL
jgi:TetR/AcrR family transcriptional repressor of lmrAB and yxaGH operons